MLEYVLLYPSKDLHMGGGGGGGGLFLAPGGGGGHMGGGLSLSTWMCGGFGGCVSMKLKVLCLRIKLRIAGII